MRHQEQCIVSCCCEGLLAESTMNTSSTRRQHDFALSAHATKECEELDRVGWHLLEALAAQGAPVSARGASLELQLHPVVHEPPVLDGVPEQGLLPL